MAFPVENAAMFIGCLAALGLMIGSFLNVVVHRLPLMMERQWAAEYAEINQATEERLPASLAQAHSSAAANPASAFNLVVPRSRCPQCDHTLAWYENIPVVSFLVLRGKCSSCGKPIGWRYPAVEISTAALFAFCAMRFGPTWTALAWCTFCAVLVAAALIDWDTTLLPDDLTLFLLWAGLVASALGWTKVTLAFSVWGAVAGYLSLWAVYWLFRLVTGKEGMGYGDFKLFAALGAWFGWPALVPIILMSSVIGAVCGIGMKLRGSLLPNNQMPFGPFLAGAGLTALIFGPQSILRVIGLD